MTVSLLGIEHLVKSLLGETDLRDAYRRYGPRLADEIRAATDAVLHEEDILVVRAGDVTRDPSMQTEWLVEILEPKRATTILTGPPNSGKTTILAHLFDAIRDGTSFLGYKCQKARALYLSEDEAGAFNSKFQAYDHMDHVVCMFPSAAYGLYSDWEDLATKVIRSAGKHQVDLVVIDTLGSWSQIEDYNDYAVVTRALMTAERIASNGYAVVIVHHDRKSGGTGLDSMLGSVAFGGRATGGVLKVSRDGATGTVTLERSRHAPYPLPTIHTTIKDGRLEVQASPPAGQQANHADESLLTYLKGMLPNGATVNDVVEVSTAWDKALSKSTARRDLTKLVRDNRVRAESEKGRGGTIRRYFAVTLPTIVLTRDKGA